MVLLDCFWEARIQLTPHLVLAAYAQGYFPMGQDRDNSEVHWFFPSERAVLPIKKFHISQKLQKILRSGRLGNAEIDVTYNQNFQIIIDSCAARTPTWINAPIRDVFLQLHALGYAHSVEIWRAGELVGGIYGLALGAAFFAESKFSTYRDASKVALVHLMARLWAGGFHLCDAQFPTPHLAQFDLEILPNDIYVQQLSKAITLHADFLCGDHNQKQILTAYLAARRG